MHAHETPVGHGPAAMRVDLATLWILERHSHLAICTLSWLPRAWEVRILIDDEALLSRRCRRQDEVVSTAQAWRRTLCGLGWATAPDLRAARLPTV